MSGQDLSRVADVIVAHLCESPEMARVVACSPAANLDEASLREIVTAAGVLAEGVLMPFNRQADAEGCTLVDGRVRLSSQHTEAWNAFVSGGWTTIDGPIELGGVGLPLAVHSACEELFNRASPAFGMLVTPIRCAARVIEQFASEAIRSEWLPRLTAGDWGATICISEADAGSDVGRLRTQAIANADGSWSLSGEKMWISFGDHGLTERIGHMVLARTPDAPVGSSGLSLFLVPSSIAGQPNNVRVRGIEEKLGLHGSPTCALGFEGSRGWLIGVRNRGLAQLFTMIIGMRLSVGSQGAGIAGAAAALAWRYASERRQGGRPDSPPVTIDQHGDIRRLLLEIAARSEIARGLVLTASLMSDLRTREEDEARREEAARLLEWLLPITKNFCAEAAFACASDAIQVLGGAGYTRDWPAEQYLRDARVLAIYEGTSGMQALDLLMRRVLSDDGRAFDVFVSKLRETIASATDFRAARQLEEICSALLSARNGLTKQSAAVIAYPFLQLASYATTGWIALRLTGLSGSAVKDHLAALGRHWLKIALPRALAEASLVAYGESLNTDFGRVQSTLIG